MNIIKLVVLFLLLINISCISNNDETKTVYELNLDHIKNLYAEFNSDNGQVIGTIAIYADHPNYKPVTAAGEGYTCVDDVARTIVLLCDDELLADDHVLYEMLEKLISFIIYMQSDNGYFYNFIMDDNTINRTGQTSVNRADWWSWRALWALEYAQSYLEESNPPLADKMMMTSQNLIKTVLEEFGTTERDRMEIEGIMLPKWLPGETAADQAAVLLLGLELHYDRNPSAEVKELMDRLAEGIMMMQHGSKDNWPYGAFFSWKNIWHAYGNIQAYALLKTGDRLNNDVYTESALEEIDHFYDYVIKEGFLNYFVAKKTNSIYSAKEQQQFPQIAYGIRPMVSACLEAYSLTGDDEYVLRAIRLASWLLGKNEGSIEMYDPGSGRCFDGLESNEKFNHNSGAESTIEALLTLQAFKLHGIKPNYFHKKLKELAKQ